MRRVALLAFPMALSFLDCSESAGGPEYTQIGIGAARPGETTDLQCTRIPVMPGGIVEREFELRGGIGAKLHGTRDGADVSFSGVENASETRRRFSHETLDAGFAERIDAVSLAAGEAYVLLINSGCGTDVAP
jgi:hypothetical protein